MKNLKRTLAVAGVVLLVLLYASTLFFALTDHTKTLGYLKASIACTILIPVLLYAFSMFYKLSHKDSDDEKPEN